MKLRVGDTLSHYRVDEEIGRGGMGIVFRAVDLGLNRPVALKVLQPHFVTDRDRRTRFIREAHAASALEHPNVAVIHEIGEERGIHFIAMELIRGEQLRNTLDRERLTVRRALDLAIEIGEGLARAHEVGILHRDLKPENIMVTADGHAKLIDFGLAKLLEPSLDDTNSETGVFESTLPGVLVGTLSYMSPEQARADSVDSRSDIFSFGILLFEMLTGALPFAGRSPIALLDAIANDSMPSLALVGSQSGRVTVSLRRAIERCLAKDPVARYQTARDLLVDLRTIRQRLDSTSLVDQLTSLPSRPGPRWAATLAAAAAMAAVLAGVFSLETSNASGAPVTTDGRQSLAVMYFENNSGDASLDWLRTGLTDMLVTDLSQSPHLEVLGTDRLHQLLKDLKRQDDRVVSFDVVQELERRTGIDTVLVGSFVQVGEIIRINVKLQDAQTGRILGSEHVETRGDSNLLTTVDDLTRRVRSRFEMATIAGQSEPTVDRDLKDVTTASIDAYRAYAEGINLHERAHEKEAVPFFEQALTYDPSFAMAFAKLAVMHYNLGHPVEYAHYSRLALEHKDRLTPRERYYIEGLHFSQRPATLSQAIAAYTEAVKRFPDHASARNNLALLHFRAERYADAIPHYEENLRRGSTAAISYGNLAGAYDALGRFDDGKRVLEQLLRRSPENIVALSYYGNHLTRAGQLDHAQQAFDRAAALNPAHWRPAMGTFDVKVLQERWLDAERATRPLTLSADSFDRWLGEMAQSTLALYRGQPHAALQSNRHAITAYRVDNANTASSRAQRMHQLLQMDRAADALDEATGDDGEVLFHRALALDRLGKQAEANAVLDQVKLFAAASSSNADQRRVHFLAGELALARGNPGEAIEELRRAESLLAPHGFVPPIPVHVPIWFALGSAYLAGDRPADALPWLERVASSGIEHVWWPVLYIRSFDLLAKAHEAVGQSENARRYRERFAAYPSSVTTKE